MATWDLPGLLLPEETLQPLLLPLPAYAWTGPRGWSFVAGLLLAGALYLSTWLGHDKFRRSRPARLPKQILKPAGWRPAAPGAGMRRRRRTPRQRLSARSAGRRARGPERSGMALEGNLSDFGLEEILQLIAVQQKSGFLILKQDQEMVFYFDRGTLVSTRDRRGPGNDPLVALSCVATASSRRSSGRTSTTCCPTPRST